MTNQLKASPRLLEGKVTIVTGAGRGLGARTAQSLAQAGAHVAVNFYRDADAAAKVVTQIEASGGVARAFQADVRDRAATERLAAAVHDEWGSIDILILNADVGGFRPSAFMDTDAAEFSVRAGNELSAAVVPVKAVLPFMRAKGAGCILAISSALCRTPVAGFSLIASSKGALEALVRSLAVELGPLGIRVNTIEASMIEGDNSDVVPAAQQEWVKRAVPLGRIARADDVARLISLIASDGAAFVNGATIAVNGGQVLFLPSHDARSVGIHL